MPELQFYDEGNIHQIQWENYVEGDMLKHYFVNLRENTTHFIQNVNTTIRFIGIDHVLIPYTINEKDYDNSYVCSPYNHYITYAKEEVKMLKQPRLEKALEKLLDAIGALTKKIQINKVVYLNNWLLSTNLFVSLNGEQINTIKEALLEKYPDYVIGFRSVNPILYPEMQETLVSKGFHLLPSRYVYISTPDVFESASKKARNTLKRDEKLLHQKEVEIIHHEAFTKEDLDRVQGLYEALYLKKYSYQNPQFTDAYIQHMHETRTLTFVGIRIDGTLQGVFASKIFQDKMANPLVGYNTDLPKELGLYRMLRYLAVLESVKHNRMYHQSAGVGRFKYDRGAKGTPEFTAALLDHLPWKRRAFWKTLSFLFLKIGVPLVEKKKL